MRAGAERAEVTVEQVVRELKLIGFSDIRKVVSWRNELVTRTEKGKDGEPVMVVMPRVTIVDADKISDEAAAAVAEVSQTVNGALRVKLHDKHAALVSIGKHLGMFVDRVQIQERKQISAEPMSAEEWKRQYVREG
jgi:phage terminase small subunit